MPQNQEDIASEKSNITKRKKKKKDATLPQEEILPHLSGMSDSWKTFYRAVAKVMKSE